MGQELMNPAWEKKPRLFYKATNSKGLQVTRGSARKRYAYCAVATDFNKWGSVWASWASTEELAHKYCKQLSKNDYGLTYEVVVAEVSTAKEVRLIKKQTTLKAVEHLSAMQNKTNTETEQENTNDNTN